MMAMALGGTFLKRVGYRLVVSQNEIKCFLRCERSDSDTPPPPPFIAQQLVLKDEND